MKFFIAVLLLCSLATGSAFAGEESNKSKEPSGTDTAVTIFKKLFIVLTLLDTASVAADSCDENNCTEGMTVEKGVNMTVDVVAHQANEIKDAFVGGVNFISEVVSE